MPSSTDLAAQQQAAQAGLVTVMSADLAGVWAFLDVSRMKATLPDFAAGVAALVGQYGKMAAAVAARYYARQRQSAGITDRFRPIPATPPGLEQVGTGVEWATRDLWTAEPDVSAARTLVLGVAEKAVLDTGRDTTQQAVIQDREAKGWHRVVEPGACAFCLMLAIRGPVYKKGSFGAADAKFTGLGEFKTHNACRCDLQPVFTAWEPSAEIRHWQSVYRQVAAGKSSKDKRIAFRQAVEGRQVTSVSSDVKRGPKVGKTGRTTMEIKAEMDALEKNLPNVSGRPLDYHRKRIAELKRLLSVGSSKGG